MVNKKNVWCNCGKVAMTNKEYCYDCYTKDYAKLKAMKNEDLLKLKVTLINECKKVWGEDKANGKEFTEYGEFLLEKISLISDIQEEKARCLY